MESKNIFMLVNNHMNQKGFTNAILLGIAIILLGVGGYFVVQNYIYNNSLVCSNDGEYKIIDKNYSIEPGSISLVVKDGVNREVFVNKLKELNLYDQSKISLSRYNPTPRSLLAFKSSSNNDYHNQIEKIKRSTSGNDLDENASYSENIFGEYVSYIYFKRILSETDKESLSLVFNIPLPYYRATFDSPYNPMTWHATNAENRVSLMVPPWYVKQSIEKLKKTEIFKCVSRGIYLSTPTQMPTPGK